MDNTENILQSHTKRIGELETKTREHDVEIRGLKANDKEFKDMFRRIDDKLDRPSWIVSALITALFSIVTGLIVFISTL